MTLKQYWVVIPASGIGSRMKASRPKQYLPFLHSTILEATLNRLLSYPLVSGAVLVINDQDEYWQELNYKHEKPLIIAHGGDERSDSVLNGLKALQQSVATDKLWVMIHDAVRPCITHHDLALLIDESRYAKDGLFLAHPVADTLKRADHQQRCIATVDRTLLWRAFTPQMFRFELIKKALVEVIQSKTAITDDISAVQYLGCMPRIIQGRSDNIKITYPEDISIAETIFKNQMLEMES